MRIALRIVAVILLTLFAAALAFHGELGAALMAMLLGSVSISVSEAVVRLGLLLEETKCQSRLLIDQRDQLKRIANIQQQSFERRNIHS